GNQDQRTHEAKALHDEYRIFRRRPADWICINGELIHTHADALIKDRETILALVGFRWLGLVITDSD
ncbi:hypothetical protein, partial [Ferrimonas pelagia]|uniref:hypothetical protein n=1 Tax=Ferrimonas pelagia TaxID=1177826 RepID=UPI0031EBFDB2